MISKYWGTWIKLPSSERDKVIYNGLFDGRADSIPLFSSNTVTQSNIDNLIAKLRDLGYGDMIVEQLPRSILSKVTINGCTVGPTPAHKAIAFFAYILAMEKK